jgi:hypothetical protein
LLVVISINIIFWLENWKENDYFEDRVVDGKLILKRILKNCDVMVWTALHGPRIVSSGGLL